MVLGIIQTIASDIPMHEWSLSTLSEILAASQPSDDPTPGQGVGDTDRDFFMSATESKAYGLIDQVIDRRPSATQPLTAVASEL